MKTILLFLIAFLVTGIKQHLKAQCVPQFTTTINGYRSVFEANSNDDGLGHIWYLGDGTIAYNKQVTHYYVNAGQYTVKHVIRNASGICYDSAITTINVIDSTAICNIQANYMYTVDSVNLTSVHFRATPNQQGYTYKWFFGDNTFGYTPNINHTYNAAGNYNVLLVITDSLRNCVDSISKTIVIANVIDSCQWRASFAQTIQQTTRMATFNALPIGSTKRYIWHFGDGVSVTTPHATQTHTYPAQGYYLVKLIVVDTLNYCLDSASNYVFIQDSCGLQASFTKIVNATNPRVVSFTPQPNQPNYYYQWYFGDNQYSNVASPTHTYAVAGSYVVSLVISNNTGTGYCRDSISQTIVVASTNPCNINANFTSSQIASTPRTVQFNAGSSVGNIGSYQWYFGDGTYSSMKNPLHTYSSQGSYMVTLKIKDSLSNCIDSIIKNIVVLGSAADSCTAGFVYTTSSNAQTTFTAQSNQPIIAANWQIINPRDSLQSIFTNVINATVQLTDTGVYNVCVNITTSTGCQKTYCSSIYNRVNGRLQISNAKLFPNPVRNQLHASFNLANAGLLTYKITNLMGNTVLQKQIQGIVGANRITIPVSQLQPGQYFLELKIGNERKSITFQKY